MGIDPVTHRPFSQMLADYGNISGLTRTQTRMGSLSRDNKNTFFMSNQEIIQQETLFPNFNNNVKMEPPEVIKTDSIDLLTQLQAITHIQDSSTNHEISFTQFHVSVASSSSSSSSTCSTLNEMTPQQTFNWRDFLIENSQDGNVNEEKLNFEAIGGIELVKGNTTSTNGVKETTEEACDGSFVEAMLNGENDMLLDFPGLLGEPSYY